MGKNDRFEKVYSQGTMNVMEIWVDRETGVNYVFHASGYAGGMNLSADRLRIQVSNFKCNPDRGTCPSGQKDLGKSYTKY